MASTHPSTSTSHPGSAAPHPSGGGSGATGAANQRPPLMSSISQTGDIALWLHNKLGTSNDLWSDNSSIISQLNKDVLTQIKNIFGELQVNVKLKLLLTFLHISRRNLEDWASELEKILEFAMEDNDPWVSVVGEMLRNYPRHGTINFDFQSNTSTFMDLVNEIKKLVKKHGDRGILPLECLYLNRPVFISSFGQLPQPEKHFTLRRKAKSATLRAELLQKASDASTGKRSTSGPTVPIRCRGLNSDSTPLKGIPSRSSFGSGTGYNSYNSSYGKAGLSRIGSLGSSTSTPSGSMSRLSRYASLSGSSSMNTKRDGGIVLLDITEAPSTLRDPKRRKTANLLPDEKKPTNTDVPESATTASIGGAPPTLSTPTATASPTLITTPTSSPLVLGHKSGISESELPGAKKALPHADPYDISRELAQGEPTRVGVASSGITASKSTPDYAAGLLGSSNSPHPVNRYHDSLGQNTSGGISLLSNTGSGTPSGMYSKAQDSLSSPLSKSVSNAGLAPNGSNSFMSSSAPSSNSPFSLSSGISNQSFFKTAGSSIQPQQQSQQQPTQVQQQQHQQVPNSYRNYATQISAQPPKMVQAQSLTNPQAPATHTNTMYGVIRQQQPSQPQLQPQAQQQQQQQRLMYNPATSSILGQQIQARPQSQSVIHPNPQQQNQPVQFGMSLQQQQQQQQRPFGMYGQLNQGEPKSQPHAEPSPQPQPQQPQAQRVLIAREITQQATAIFNISNCLTRPEKALILGFMAGTQSNPAPQMGPVCMIRYLEKLEDHQTATGEVVAVVVEEHFQMNFNTGEWKTVRSVRQAESNYQVGNQDHLGNQTRIVVLDPNQRHHFVTINSGRSQQPVLVSNTGTGQPQQLSQHAMQQGQMASGQMMPGQQVRPGVPGSQQFMRA